MDGIRWIRLHYAYPRDVPDALVETIADEPKIVKYLDMPLQHSSDRLLRAMKRGRDSVFLRELLARLRGGVPGLVLRTSLIVGLPGETEADFEGLVRFVEESRFERLGVFEFSAEDGTPAAEMARQVPAKVKRARFERVMELQQGISRAHQRALIGRRLEVLVEGASEETEHLLAGRHAQQAPEIDGLTYVNDGVAYPGEIVTVEVTDASDYDLVGKVVARDRSRPVAPAAEGSAHAGPAAAAARPAGRRLIRAYRRPPNIEPRRPRITARPICVPAARTALCAILPMRSPASPPTVLGAARPRSGGCSAGTASARACAFRCRSSYADSRSIGASYRPRSGELASACARSSGVSGAIRERGGRTSARSTGRGVPFSSRKETSASPTASSVIAVATSTPGFARKVSAAARTAF